MAQGLIEPFSRSCPLIAYVEYSNIRNLDCIDMSLTVQLQTYRENRKTCSLNHPG